LLWWRNSIGSSTVMMWSRRVRFARSMIEASVVDLPEPVGPVTSTMPRARPAMFETGRRDAEVLQRLDLVRDQAERRAERLALPVDVHAEAGDVRDGVGEVELEHLLEAARAASG
jgi:hypothetical protein